MRNRLHPERPLKFLQPLINRGLRDLRTRLGSLRAASPELFRLVMGAAFMLFKGSSDEAPPNAAPGTPGHVGWHELHAGDGPAAFGFYSGLFGWTADRAMDMGEMGVYQLFAAGGPAIGGMMTKMPDVPAPNWLYYFNVDAVEPAMERVKQGGGQVLNGPMEVPGPMWIAQCIDPQGAMFAMVGAKK